MWRSCLLFFLCSHLCPLELEIFLNSALPLYLICWLCEIFVACLLVCQPIQLILSSHHLIWFPRMFIWRSLLKLPENHSAFSSLVDKGTHNAFARLHEEYPIKSRKLLRVLQRLVYNNNIINILVYFMNKRFSFPRKCSAKLVGKSTCLIPNFSFFFLFNFILLWSFYFFNVFFFF